MDADGGNPTRLTNNAANDWDPAWSPDGSQIAFISDREGNFDIYMVGANGGSPTLFARGSSGYSFHPFEGRIDYYYNLWSPVWSPDGRHIAFVGDDDGSGIGNTYTHDGSGNWREIDFGGNWDPVWSPDGRHIAYVDNCDIYVESKDGGRRTNIFDSSGCDLQHKGTRSPVWSPNGRRIALYFYGPDPNFDIYVIDADGRNLTRLTEHAADDESPVWSPDSVRLAFHSDREGNFDIYVMDADGDNPTRLTEHAADDESPVWSPDGSRIAFVSFRQGNREIYVIDVD